MKKSYSIALACLIGFIIVTILVVTNNMVGFDNFIYSTLYGLNNRSLDIFLITITSLANPKFIVVVAILLMFVIKENKYRLLILANIGLSVGFNFIIKHIICRARPDHIRLVTEKGYSYPSGHSMISVLLYGTLMYILIKNIKDKKLKVLLEICFSILIFLIGISRIYVGVHYPSDVLGGFLISIAILIASIIIFNKHFKGE